MNTLKYFLCLNLILLPAMVFSQKLGPMPDFEAKCTSVKDPDCKPDPKICQGKSFCSQYPGRVISYLPLLMSPDYWQDDGVFTARGIGSNCQEAKADATERFHLNFSSLCGGQGPAVNCERGFSLKEWDCYSNGKQVVAYMICDNRKEGKPEGRPRPRMLGTCGPKGCI